MKAYLSVFKMRMINGLQYRTAALAGIDTQFSFGFTFIMIYEAFYRNSAASQPISLDQLIDFVWLQQAFLVFIVLWLREMEIIDLITSGNIAYELCRPCSIYNYWFSKLIAQRLSGAFLRCLPILVFAYLLPEPYKLSLPENVTVFVLFAVTLILGLFVMVAISMFIYVLVFITMSPMGALLMVGVIGEFLAGLVVPVPLMPVWLQRISYILPFRLASDLPFRVYSGNIQYKEAMISILIQLVWLAMLVIAGKAAMRGILKRVVVQGG